jgi:integrase
MEIRCLAHPDGLGGHLAVRALPSGRVYRPAAGELLGLRWADLRPDYGSVVVREQVQHGKRAGLKTGKKGWRVVPLPPTVSEALRVHRADVLLRRVRARKWTDHDLVFPCNVGTPINPSNIRREASKVFDRAAKQTPDLDGLRYRGLHIFRHIVALLQLAEGAELHEVSKLLGHTTIRITADLYSHLMDRQRQAVAERSERLAQRMMGAR